MIVFPKTMQEIADAHKVSIRFVFYVKNGERYTFLPQLAIDIARLTGKRPITYFNPEYRRTLKKFTPQLWHKV